MFLIRLWQPKIVDQMVTSGTNGLRRPYCDKMIGQKPACSVLCLTLMHWQTGAHRVQIAAPDPFLCSNWRKLTNTQYYAMHYYAMLVHQYVIPVQAQGIYWMAKMIANEVKRGTLSSLYSTMPCFFTRISENWRIYKECLHLGLN